jgi:mannosyltransferase
MRIGSSDPERQLRLRLAAIVALAAVLRVIFLGPRSFWNDEIVSVNLAAAPWQGFTFWVLRREANMALYYLALRQWVRFGDGEAWVRLFSALLGIITVPMLFVLGRRLRGERFALIAALVAATNACAVQFSQDARSYSMLMLLAVLSYYFFLKIVEESSLGAVGMYVVVSALSLYAHFFAALMICAQIISLLWLPRAKVPWLRLAGACLVLAATAIPIAIFVLRNDVGQLSWVKPTTISEVYRLFVFFAGASKVAAAVLSVVSLGVCAFAISHFSTALRGRSDDSWKIALVVNWAFLPPLLTVLLALHRPLFVHRYLLISLPGYLLLLAVGLSLFKQKTFIILMWVYCVLSAASIVQGYLRPLEDWRGVASYVLQNSAPGDTLLAYLPYSASDFDFYAERIRKKEQHPPIVYLDGTAPVSQVATVAAPRIWLLLYPSPHTGELTPQLESGLAARYSTEARRDFRGVSVILFSGLKPPSSLPQAGSAPHP